MILTDHQQNNYLHSHFVTHLIHFIETSNTRIESKRFLQLMITTTSSEWLIFVQSWHRFDLWLTVLALPESPELKNVKNNRDCDVFVNTFLHHVYAAHLHSHTANTHTLTHRGQLFKEALSRNTQFSMCCRTCRLSTGMLCFFLQRDSHRGHMLNSTSTHSSSFSRRKKVWNAGPPVGNTQLHWWRKQMYMSHRSHIPEWKTTTWSPVRRLLLSDAG